MKEEDKSEQAIANPEPGAAGELTPTELNAVVGGTINTLLDAINKSTEGGGGCTTTPTTPTKPLKINVQGQM